MILFGLLFLPVLLGLAGLIFGKGKVTLKEFLVHEAIVVVILTSGFFIARCGAMTDTEIWNGRIARKWEESGSCCHSYRCNCHEVCNSEGESCHESCDTCYEHISDDEWHAISTNNEIVFSDNCNRPGSAPPSRWLQIVPGEPTAVEHWYQNYIKGNHDSIFRREGAKARFKRFIPEYPEVYDYYRANRFLAVGVAIPNLHALNQRLGEINGRLGAAKQVHIIVLVVPERDPMYLEGLREAWLGGKKNDFIVVIGAPEYPAIAWAGAISWTRVEELKLAVRDRIMELETFQGERVLQIVHEEVRDKFIRRPMSDFEYLRYSVTPPEWASWMLFFLGVIIAVALQWYFWNEDPFGDGLRRRY